MNPYYLLIGGFALWYIPTAIALLKMDFKVNGLQIRSIQADYIDLSVNIDLINKTPIPFTVSRINMSVYLNGTYISEMFAQNIGVPSNSTGRATALLRLRKEEIGAALWNILITNNFNNSVISFKGVASSVGRNYPFTSDLKISDIGKS